MKTLKYRYNEKCSAYFCSVYIIKYDNNLTQHVVSCSYVRYVKIHM